MDLHVSKNIQFTKLVKAPVQQREFNFRKIPNKSIELFHVDVSDEKMNRFMFQVQKETDGHWKIVSTSLPVWICEVEQKLDEILEHESSLWENRSTTME